MLIIYHDKCFSIPEMNLFLVYSRYKIVAYIENSKENEYIFLIIKYYILKFQYCKNVCLLYLTTHLGVIIMDVIFNFFNLLISPQFKELMFKPIVILKKYDIKLNVMLLNNNIDFDKFLLIYNNYFQISFALFCTWILYMIHINIMNINIFIGYQCTQSCG